MAKYARIAKHKSEPADYRRAKELRKASPPAEQTLWYKLRLNSKNLKIRFRQQHPIHPYIVDFICLKLRLIIEVDGPSHDTRLASDKNRDDYLKNLGYEVMRFTNEDVRNNPDGVVQTIMLRADELKASLCIPLP